MPARCGSQVGPAHGLSLAAARPEGRRPARPRAERSAAADPPLRAVQHVHRGGGLLALLVTAARDIASLRRREPGRPADDGADAKLYGAVFRADGPAVAARWDRAAGNPPRSPREARARRRGA